MKKEKRKYVQVEGNTTTTTEWDLWDYLEEILKKVEDIEDKLGP